jgi:hypothetical protein
MPYEILVVHETSIYVTCIWCCDGPLETSLTSIVIRVNIYYIGVITSMMVMPFITPFALWLDAPISIHASHVGVIMIDNGLHVGTLSKMWFECVSFGFSPVGYWL